MQDNLCPTTEFTYYYDLFVLLVALFGLYLNYSSGAYTSQSFEGDEKHWRKAKYARRVHSDRVERHKKSHCHTKKPRNRGWKRKKQVFKSHNESGSNRWYAFNAMHCFNGMMNCKNLLFDLLGMGAAEAAHSSVATAWHHRDAVYGNSMSISKKLFDCLLIAIQKCWEGMKPLLTLSFVFIYASVEMLWSHFALIRACAIAKSLKNVVLLALKLGIIPGLALEFLGFPLISKKMKQEVSLLELISAIGELFALVFDACVKFYSTGDFMVFYADAVVAKFEQRYAVAVQNWPLHEARKLDMPEGEYEREINELWFLASRLLADNPQDKSFFAPRFEKLHSLKVKMMLAHKEGIRIKPLGVLICGASGVGKTTIATALTRYMLKINKFDSSQKSVVTLNDMDKFMSEVRSYHSGYIIDDVAQGKSDKTEGNPLLRLFQILSNIPMAALTAIAELKGEVMINAKVLLATTNVPHLHAHEYVTSPGAAVRRFEVHVTQRARKEFCFPGSTNLDPEKCKVFKEDTIPDYARFDIKYVALSEGTGGPCDNSYTMVPYKHRGRPMFDVDTATFLECLRDISVAHFNAQRDLVSNYNSKENVPMCEHFNLPEVCHHCAKEQGKEVPEPNINGDMYKTLDITPRETTDALPQLMKEQNQEESSEVEETEDDKKDEASPVAPQRRVNPIVVETVDERTGEVIPDGVSVRAPVEQEPTPDIRTGIPVVSLLGVALPESSVSESEADFDSQMFGIENLMNVVEWLTSIEEYVCSSIEDFLHILLSMTPVIMWWYKKQIRSLICNWCCLSFCLILGTVCVQILCDVHRNFILLCYICSVFVPAVCAYDHVNRFIASKRCVLSTFSLPRPSEVFQAASWPQKMAFVVAIGGVVSLKRYIAYLFLLKSSMAKFIHLRNEGAGSMIPEHWSDIGSEKYAAQSDLDPLAKTGTSDQLTAIVRKRQSVMTIMDGFKKFSRCNCFPLYGDFWIIPNHMIPKKQMSVRIDRPGTYHVNTVISPELCQRFAGTDLALWKVGNAGTLKDLRRYIAKKIPDKTVQEVMMCYNDGNEVKVYDPMACKKRVAKTTKGGTFEGFEYDFPGMTFDGQCMGTLMAQSPQPYILAWHLAGRGKVGFSGFITQESLKETVDEFFKKRPHLFESHSATPMVTRQMDKEFGPLTPPHELSAVHSLPKDSVVEVLGGHALPRSNWVSGIRRLKISESVEDIMDIKREHGRPQGLNDPKLEEEDLMRRTHTAFDFDQALLGPIYEDYKKRILDGLTRDMLKKVGKLDLDNCIAGCDQVFGVNHVAYDTSTGFPLGGAKYKRLVDSERPVEGVSCPKDLDPAIEGEVVRILDCYSRGESANTVFNAAKKDEATKKDSHKIRVFAGCNLAFCIVVRMYFLTLAKLVMENSLLFECAVGINVNSPEWTKFVDHICKYGKDRLVAGDYSKFDSKMSVQFMQMAFKILIDIAILSGNYDEEDIKIMKGIATDICNPTYNYFGTLMRFAGSNPSGHPLTTIINSMVNSLYMRYVYYVIAKGWWTRPPAFGDVVSLMTYGDDNAMSVKRGFNDFNHTRIAEELAKCGIKYTMADKEAKSVPYIGIDKLSFLKHTPRYDDEMKLYRAEIDPSSIAKQLHCHKKGALSENMACREAIFNVLNNYFEFGEEEYTKRALQLAKVAEDCELSGIVGTLPTYEKKMEEFREKYPS